MVDANFLATIPIFSSLTTAELNQLAVYWTPVVKRKSQIIFKKGDPGNSIFLVQSGAIQINITALLGEEVNLTILHKGDMFGELTLFDNMPRTATAKSVGKTELLVMP